ncbi:LpqB family beta-propeller domain-containing protein [Marmoricola sp. RAF53]|uniref:LpqB family beta-propeller domain-containing protein n=1 Tax=Marmoricola sp. RAF53 TaxID=3233059 RepID=UPI003F9DB6E2
MSAGNRVRVLTLAALLLLALVTGCTTLPTTGEVHTRPDADASASNQAPYFVPPGPTPGDDREGVVRGFLLAMQANPPSTTVARSFLSSSARASWKPVGGTIVYDSSSVVTEGDQVVARLGAAHRLDATGTWDASAPAGTQPVPFSLVQENGEWRIDNPPNALAVPASYFSSLFVPFHLYFFDRTGTVLVPTRVYLPRGEQTATNLVRGILAGPPAGLSGVVSSAFPPRTALDLAVVVSDEGVAEVPLGPDLLKLSPADLNRAVVQLAWALRQVPGITRIRLTVDGVTVPLPDGRSDVGVLEGIEYDPLTAPSRDLVAVADGRVVQEDSTGSTPVGGPFGRTGFALRSVALDADRHLVAAVASNGRQVYRAPDQGSRAASRVQTLLTGGTSLLRPAYDRFGGLWVVDATARGAVVHLIVGRSDRVVHLPGISGRRISAFTVSRDGTRFVAALVDANAPAVLVSPLLRDAAGRFVRADPPTRVGLGADEVGPIKDVSQSGATTVAVLTQAAGGPGRIVFVEMDGSPGEPGARTPDLVPGQIAAIAASPDTDLTLRVVTGDQHLLTLEPSGQWVRSPLTDVLAAAYPQ